jgi:hypothetical protein
MTLITLGFSPNTQGGVQGLIEHCLWLRGDDPRLVHAFLIVGNYVIDRTFGGLRVLPLSDCYDLVQASMANMLIAEVDFSVDEFISTALSDVSSIGPMSIIDAFRWWHRMPIGGVTCLSYLYQFLGGNVEDHVDHVDLIRQFMYFVYALGGTLVTGTSTLPYELLRIAHISPFAAYLLSEGHDVKEN